MTEMKKYLIKVRLMKMRYFLVVLTMRNRVKWLRKHNVFGYLGKGVLFQPRILPNNPKLLKLHDNVKVASGVIFYEHDVINSVFSKVKQGHWQVHHSCIEILDNCFIGGGSILVGDLRIGPNAIVAAGSVVVKDVPPGTIVGGNPAKVIGKFDDLLNKRLHTDYEQPAKTNEELWEEFYKSREGK